MEMVPACHPYIQTLDGTPDYAMILAAAHSALCKNPNLTQTWVEITEHLLSAAIIPTGFPLDETSVANHTCYDSHKNTNVRLYAICALFLLYLKMAMWKKKLSSSPYRLNPGRIYVLSSLT